MIEDERAVVGGFGILQNSSTIILHQDPVKPLFQGSRVYMNALELDLKASFSHLTNLTYTRD